MCPGMRPATGWMAYFTETPSFFSKSPISRSACCAWLTAMPYGQLPDLVLGPGHGHAVARNDDDLLCVTHHRCSVHRAEFLHRTLDLAVARLGLAGDRGEDDVGDRTVHGLGHQLGEQGAGGTDDDARDDEGRVAQHVALEADGEPGEGVQQGDHDRHVRAADGQGHQYAQRQRGDVHQGPQRAQRRRRLAERMPALPERNLRDCQVSAVTGLEQSLALNKPRALVHMATGAGKTRLARRIFELKKSRNQVDGSFVEVNCATVAGDGAMAALLRDALALP